MVTLIPITSYSGNESISKHIVKCFQRKDFSYMGKITSENINLKYGSPKILKQTNGKEETLDFLIKFFENKEMSKFTIKTIDDRYQVKCIVEESHVIDSKIPVTYEFIFIEDNSKINIIIITRSFKYF
jgi:hypothetical protein